MTIVMIVTSTHYILIRRERCIAQRWKDDEASAHLPVRVTRRLVKPVHLINQIRRTASVPQICPLAAVSDREYLVANSDGAALLNSQLRGPVHARLQHVHTEGATFCSSAFVDLVERHAVLQRTFLDQLFAGDVLVLVGHAHGEAEGLLDGVGSGSAELEHVAEALLGTMHAGDAVVVVGDAGYVSLDCNCWQDRIDEPSDVRQLEVHLVADVLHCRQHHIMQAVPRIRTFGHDERFQRYSAGAVGSVVLGISFDGDEGHAEDHEEEQQASDAKDYPLVPFSRCSPGPGAHISSLGFVDVLL